MVATRLERHGEPLALMLHDDALLEDPGLVESVSAAARLAVDNERLQAQLRAQLDEVRASRARIIESADAERRRIERNLHDGAQQRLLTLAVALQSVADHAGDLADPGLREALAEASGELKLALAELRELARGIHPAILDGGLGPAVRSLVRGNPVPTRVTTLTSARFSPAVEAAAYFVIAEALTNVSRYSQAQGAAVEIIEEGDHLQVRVSDDGVGGADPRNGSGLRGLQDRLSVLDGTLRIDSPVGNGTTVTARIPVQAPVTVDPV
jgi:signal transduction histidine kinase